MALALAVEKVRRTATVLECLQKFTSFADWPMRQPEQACFA